MLRAVSRGDRQDLDQDFFRRRIEQASEYRDRRNIDAKLRRVVWSESDGLPGVIIDRYGDDFVLQTLTLAMDMRKDLITAAMVDLFGDIAIVERNDAPVRKAEGLELRSGVLRGTPSQITIEVEGVELEVDFLRGHKTGLYLDQKHNYGIVAHYARDRRVLDCFTNQGAFALTCARAGAIGSNRCRRKFGEHCCRETKRCAQRAKGRTGCSRMYFNSCAEPKKQAHSMI